ncbi:MAG TPA: aspartate aminotransferase family protein [Acidimicrobiia bacterium]|nr:aspartate aminotransferase family protein [Acidimicrobiia bacterium]
MVATGHKTELAALDRIIAAETDRFRDRMKTSADFASRAGVNLAGGVTSSWQISDPHPIWIDRGQGSKVFDVDGHQYIDFHGGYGAMLAGHAHPAIVRAVKDRVGQGTHFAQPVPDALLVAQQLAQRYGLPLWRFGNSGTEATMDAVHLMRAITGRDLLIKFEGAYHGHHDSVQVSTWVEDDLGAARRPDSVAASAGIPSAIVSLTKVAPFNDLEAVEAIFADHAGQIAGIIVEPVLMNCGIVPPFPGFLQGLRDLTRAHGSLLAYDEVKTGLTLGKGGATRLFGVTPDIVCLAKSLGGGLPVAALGGSKEVMETIASGRYEQVGTFNGNPLGMAAARAMLTEVMIPETYEHLEQIERHMGDGARTLVEEYELPAYVVDLGAKGSVTYSKDRVTNYRQFLEIDGRYALAAWLTQFNRGVFLPPWTKGEQWLVSVQHQAADIDRYLETLEVFAQMLRGRR